MDEFFQNSAVDGNSEPVNEPVTEPVQQESFKTCERCNARLTPEQRFCPNCGKAVKNTNPSPHLVTEKKKKEHVISFVKSTLVLLLAVFVTIAAFLPLVDVGTEGYLEFSDDEIEMSIGFGAIDSIKTLVCSLDSLDEEEVEEIIEEIREEMEEYTEDWEDGEELDKLAYYGK